MKCPDPTLTVECRLQPRIQLASVEPEHVLGESCFSVGDESCTALHATLALGLTGLDEQSSGETWLSRQPASPGVYGDIAFSRTDHALFGCVSRQIGDSRKAFEQAVYKAYEDIFNLLDKSRMPRLVRMWNSFPRINEVIEGLERYQQFTVSRYNAFEEHYGEFIDRLPAATAVGGKGDRLSIYFIATDLNPVHCENSRQVCAYDYPDPQPVFLPRHAHALARRRGLLRLRHRQHRRPRIQAHRRRRRATGRIAEQRGNTHQRRRDRPQHGV